MRKRILKKSEVLREGYIKGLKHAQRIINEMLDKDYISQFLVADITETVFVDEWIFPDERDRDPKDFQRKLTAYLEAHPDFAEELNSLYEDG